MFGQIKQIFKLVFGKNYLLFLSPQLDNSCSIEDSRYLISDVVFELFDLFLTFVFKRGKVKIFFPLTLFNLIS